MSAPLPFASHFTHLDMATGRSARVPLNLEREKQRDTLAIMLKSQRTNRSITWAEGLALFVDLNLCGHGVATVMLTAACNLCLGKIGAGEVIYSMGVAVSPRIQEMPWETLGKLYLHATIAFDANFNALGDIPDEQPWAAGFAWPCTAALGDEGRLLLVNYARLAAVSVVNRCRDVYLPNGETARSHPDDLPPAGADPLWS